MYQFHAACILKSYQRKSKKYMEVNVLKDCLPCYIAFIYKSQTYLVVNPFICGSLIAEHRAFFHAFGPSRTFIYQR